MEVSQNRCKIRQGVLEDKDQKASLFRKQGRKMQQGQEDLKKLIKESIREVLREERLGLCEIMIPRVSRKELHEIHTQFSSPADYGENDFTDMTDWVKG